MSHLHRITRGFIANLNPKAAAWEKGHATPEYLYVRAVDLMGEGIPRDIYALITVVGHAMCDVDEAMCDADMDDCLNLAHALNRDWCALDMLHHELNESQA